MMAKDPIEQVAVTQEDLAPCDFCGKAPELTHVGMNAGAVVILCLNNACKVRPHTDPLSLAEAIAAWNTRASVPLPTRPVSDQGYVEAVGRDIRIAIWNACCWQGKPQEVAQSFIRKAMEEPTMQRALAAISVPLPTLTGEPSPEAVASKLDAMAAEDEHWDNDDLAATHRQIAKTIRAQQIQLEELREALTPSAATKAAYMGEFKFSVPDFGNPAGHRYVEVPWSTIKKIMEAIRARKALGVSLG